MMDIEQLRLFCLGLPAVTEDVKWEADLCFSVGGKMFCVAGLEAPFKASLKVPDEAFETLTQQPGIVPAPYLARAKWVQVSEAARLNKKEWEDLITQSYQLIKVKLTKKTQKELGLA